MLFRLLMAHSCCFRRQFFSLIDTAGTGKISLSKTVIPQLKKVCTYYLVCFPAIFQQRHLCQDEIVHGKNREHVLQQKNVISYYLITVLNEIWFQHDGLSVPYSKSGRSNCLLLWRQLHLSYECFMRKSRGLNSNQ